MENPNDERIKSMTTLTEFLSARLDDEEARALAAADFGIFDGLPWASLVLAATPAQDEHVATWDPARVLAEVAVKRRIVERHAQWPVLVTTEPEYERVGDDETAASVAFRMTQRVAWLTQQEYRARFGDEPPTAPIIAELASTYADHPDYDEEWKP